jgi:hypothetical protein
MKDQVAMTVVIAQWAISAIWVNANRDLIETVHLSILNAPSISVTKIVILVLLSQHPMLPVAI